MKGIAISMENKYSAPAVEKMLDIAELLSRSDSGYSINEIARLTGSPVNTVYRICMVLNERGYLISDPESGHFVPGSGFYFLGKAAERRMKLNTAAGPLLGRLAKESGESTQLVTLRENFAVIQMQFDKARRGDRNTAPGALFGGFQGDTRELTGARGRTAGNADRHDAEHDTHTRRAPRGA